MAASVSERGYWALTEAAAATSKTAMSARMTGKLGAAMTVVSIVETDTVNISQLSFSH